MSEALKAMDAARIGPHVTTPASRHAAMIAEHLVLAGDGDPILPQLIEEPNHCGESIAWTVAGFWRSQARLLEVAGAVDAWRDARRAAVAQPCAATFAALGEAESGLMDVAQHKVKT